MTKMADMRKPMRPSNSLPASQAMAVSAAAVADSITASGAICLARMRVTSCRLPIIVAAVLLVCLEPVLDGCGSEIVGGLVKGRKWGFLSS